MSTLIQQPTINNWTPEKISLLLKWRQHSRVYHWLHAKTSSYKHWWYSFFSYIATCLTIVGLGKNFSIFLTEGTDAFVGLQIADTILLSIIGIINVYIKTSKISELAERHINTSKDFYSLQNEIDEQLAQSPEDRDNGKIYVKKIRVKITSLTKDSPEISQTIWKKFSTAVKNKEIFNESDPITVYTKAETLVHSEIKIDDTLYSSEQTPHKSIAHDPTIDNIKIDITPTNPDASASATLPKTSTEPSHIPVNIKNVQQDFTNRIAKYGKIEPNILKALDYQMARFN